MNNLKHYEEMLLKVAKRFFQKSYADHDVKIIIMNNNTAQSVINKITSLSSIIDYEENEIDRSCKSKLGIQKNILYILKNIVFLEKKIDCQTLFKFYYEESGHSEEEKMSNQEIENQIIICCHLLEYTINDTHDICCTGIKEIDHFRVDCSKRVNDNLKRLLKFEKSKRMYWGTLLQFIKDDGRFDTPVGKKHKKLINRIKATNNIAELNELENHNFFQK